MSKTPALPNELLRIQQVANMLSVSDKTVRRMIDSGQLKSCKLRGLRMVFWSDLQRFLDELRQGGKSYA